MVDYAVLNLSFHFCVQMCFPSICHACNDLLKFDAIFLLLDVWWCYWYACHGFLGILKISNVWRWWWSCCCFWNPSISRICMNCCLVLLLNVAWCCLPMPCCLFDVVYDGCMKVNAFCHGCCCINPRVLKPRKFECHWPVHCFIGQQPITTFRWFGQNAEFC